MFRSKYSSSGYTRLAIGCGSFVLFFVVFVCAVMLLGFKYSRSSFSGVKHMTEIITQDGDIINQSDFRPPQDGLMSLEQVESLVYIQTSMKDAMGAEYDELIPTYQLLAKEMKGISDLMRFRRLIAFSSPMLKPLLAAKRAQVEAINRESITKAEYQWMKNQATQAFGFPEYAVDLSHVLTDLKGTGDEAEDQVSHPLHPSTRDLLKAHRDILNQTLVLTAVGL